MVALPPETMSSKKRKSKENEAPVKTSQAKKVKVDDEVVLALMFKAPPAFFDETPEIAQVKTFSELNISKPLLKAITELGWTQPTPIQVVIHLTSQLKAIPLGLAGRDICGSAITGSGESFS